MPYTKFIIFQNNCTAKKKKTKKLYVFQLNPKFNNILLPFTLQLYFIIIFIRMNASINFNLKN